MRFTGGQTGGGHTPQFVEHAYRVGAPGFAHIGRGLQGPLKARVAHGEILRAVVKRAKWCTSRGHAPTHCATFFEYGHLVTGLKQGARAGDARHSSADNRDIFDFKARF